MKLIIGIIATSLLSGATLGQSSTKISWFLFDEHNKTWCGYSREASFQEKSDKENSLESARVSLLSWKPLEITYQVQPESGDWVMADKYSFLPGRIDLKRVTIYAQSGVQVVQQASVRGGVATNLKLVSVKNIDGSVGDIRGIDVPSAPVKTRLNQFRFLPVAQIIAKRRSSILCGSPGKP